MYAGITDEDVAKRSLFPTWTIRFQKEGGVSVPTEEMVGKTFKIVREVTRGHFIIEEVAS